MDLGQLFFLPEWKDEFYFNDDDNEGEEWKINDSFEIAKALYNQWREVFHLIIAFTDSLPEEEENGFTQKLIIENVLTVAPKIISAARDTLYIIKMENAAIIRINCIQLMEQIGFAILMKVADENHKEVIDYEMDKFRILFKQWAITFKKDDCDDDWGLFV